MDAVTHHSFQSKRRVDSFDSIDSSFDVVSVDESIEERIDVESDLDPEDEEIVVDQARDDPQDGDEWEDVVAAMAGSDTVDVEIESDEGFQDAIEAALQSVAPQSAVPAPPPPMTRQPIKPPTSPRRRSARELLRDFYLARAKNSEESSKNYRSYEPKPFIAPVEIAPLRAPERYDVELYERGVREVNQRNAQRALREFYADRDAVNAQRALENRANERFVYASQIGSSAMRRGSQDRDVVAMVGTSSLYWETTRFVFNSSAAETTPSAHAVST